MDNTPDTPMRPKPGARTVVSSQELADELEEPLKEIASLEERLENWGSD